MSAFTDAVLFYGLFSTSSAVDPYDVREGVDNGEGLPGTLTSPPGSKVERNYKFGGNGDQYIGTLYVPDTSGTSWTGAMDELFEDMRAEPEYRAEFTYNNQTIIGVKLPLSLAFTMKISGYTRTADTSVDLYRWEVESIGLYSLATARNPAQHRPEVTVNGQPFFVLDCKDDDVTDPTVKLILAARQ